METLSVKTLALVLVGAVGIYAIYKLVVEGNPLLGGLGTPGLTTPNLTSVSGVPQYQTGITSATPGAISSIASSALSEYAPAFGTGENDQDDTDYSDLDMDSDD